MAPAIDVSLIDIYGRKPSPRSIGRLNNLWAFELQTLLTEGCAREIEGYVRCCRERVRFHGGELASGGGDSQSANRSSSTLSGSSQSGSRGSVSNSLSIFEDVIPHHTEGSGVVQPEVADTRRFCRWQFAKMARCVGRALSEVAADYPVQQRCVAEHQRMASLNLRDFALNSSSHTSSQTSQSSSQSSQSTGGGAPPPPKSPSSSRGENNARVIVHEYATDPQRLERDWAECTYVHFRRPIAELLRVTERSGVCQPCMPPEFAASG